MTDGPAGRADASQDQTDALSFAVMEPEAEGFRNWHPAAYRTSAEEMLIDRAQLLTLSAPEMTVLVAGLRVLGANAGGNEQGVFTARSGVLSTDFFANVLDIGTARIGRFQIEREPYEWNIAPMGDRGG